MVYVLLAFFIQPFFTHHDSRNRLNTVTYSGASGNLSQGRTYVYDADSNLLSTTETYADSNTRSNTAYAYDALNRATSETSNGLTNTYGYDLAGNRLLTTYGYARSDARTLYSTYDGLNRLASLTELTGNDSYGTALGEAESGRNSLYLYDLDGHRVKLQQASAAVITTEYDALGRQANITGPTLPGTPKPQYVYSLNYDAFSNLAQQVETYSGGELGNRTVTLGYDGADRLLTENITASNTTVTNYTYDNANNRLTKVVTSAGSTTSNITYHYTDTNELGNFTDTIPSRTVSYIYDNNGSRISRHDSAVTSGNTTYTYDYENRLVNTFVPTGGQGAGNYTYEYDYRTRRVLRDESAAGGNLTDVIFSGGTSIREYTSSLSGNLAVQYIRGSDWGGGVGGILYSLNTGVPSYYHYDGRGDVVAQTNSSHSLTYQAAYEAFGKHNSVPGTQEYGSSSNRQRANTKDEDPTGLLNEGARPRDLETGEFITRDPLGFAAGTNPYTYVLQNPYTHFDPEGLINETFGGDNWFMNYIMPDPMAEYHAGENSAEQMIGGNGGWDKAGGTSGTLGHGIMAVMSVIPGEGLIGKGILNLGEKTLLKDATVDAARATVENQAAKDTAKATVEGSAKADAEKAAGGIGPVEKGKAGVEKSKEKAIAAGEKIKGEEVTFELPSGKRTRTDLITETKEGATKGVESKNGPGARLSPGQKEMQQTSANGGQVIPRGKNAADAGFELGKPIQAPTYQIDQH